MALSLSDAEAQSLDALMSRVRAAILAGETIRYADPQFSGAAAGLQFQFEGEEDLLHLVVTALNGGEPDLALAQALAARLLAPVSPALYWMRPGELSHHFYLAHDRLIEEMPKR